MDAADTLARLHDVRNPATGMAEAVADVLAGGSVGLLAALIVFVLLRAVTRRPPTWREIVRADLMRASRLAPDQRLLALAKLIDRITPELSCNSGADGLAGSARSSENAPWQRITAELRQALYRRKPTIDLDRVEMDILQLLSSRKR
jgi:hypothetical protein